MTVHQYIVVGSYRGFGNRLRVLTTYIHLATLIFNSSHIYFTWDINKECPGHFLEVYQPLENVTFIHPDDFKILEKGAVFARSPDFTYNKNTYEIFKYHNIPYVSEDWHKIRRGIYSQMRPTYYIEKIYKNFVKANSICSMSAIHVRQTDLQRVLMDNNYNYSTNEDFFRFIASRPEKEKIFLMTDNRHTQLLFLNKYPQKIITYDIITETMSTDCLSLDLRCTSLAQTVIEMYIAAHAIVFEGSILSATSETIRTLRHYIDCKSLDLNYKYRIYS
jgi:hypothetical protein